MEKRLAVDPGVYSIFVKGTGRTMPLTIQLKTVVPWPTGLGLSLLIPSKVSDWMGL